MVLAVWLLYDARETKKKKNKKYLKNHKTKWPKSPLNFFCERFP